MQKSELNDIEILMFTVKQTAQTLQISQKSVYRLLDRNLLQASRALRHKRISKKSIDEFINSTTTQK